MKRITNTFIKYKKDGNTLIMNVDAKHPDSQEVFHIISGDKLLYMRISVKEDTPTVYTAEEFKKKFPYYNN